MGLEFRRSCLSIGRLYIAFCLFLFLFFFLLDFVTVGSLILNSILFSGLGTVACGAL